MKSFRWVGCFGVLVVAACGRTPNAHEPALLTEPLQWAGQPLLQFAFGDNGDQFAHSVAVTGDVAVVGGPNTSTYYLGSSAYVYRRTAGVWDSGTLLGEAFHSTQFGIATAASGNTIAVSAVRQDNGSLDAPGVVKVWVASDSGWNAQGTLTVPSSSGGLALSGDTLLAGCNGVASIFVRTGASWAEQSPALKSPAHYDGDRFGMSVGLSGDTAVVGASGANATTLQRGAAFVFVRSGTTWTQQGPALQSSDGFEGDQLGASVAISGDTIVVGAPHQTVAGNVAQGAAYVFVRNGTAWSQQGNALLATDGKASDLFGSSLAISGNRVLIGAPHHVLNSNNTGAAYLFERAGAVWGSPAVLSAIAPAPGGERAFGSAVALDGENALVGDEQYALKDWSPVPSNTYYEQGAAFPFVLTGAPCTSASECASGVCSDGVCCNAPCSGACDACSKALGAASDGVCTNLPAGSVGEPACSLTKKACTGASYCTTCTADSDCSPDSFCQSTQCLPRIALGEACKTTQCKAPGCRACQGDSSVCQPTSSATNGVCCDSQCDAPCSACTVAQGASRDGHCGPRSAGFVAAGCAMGYACNGSSTSCSTQCSSDLDCDANYYCNAQGACTARKARGATCDATSGGDCKLANCRVCSGGGQNGTCVDGVCCNEACDGACDACAVSAGASIDGTCTILPAGSAAHPSCPSAKSCDGVKPGCPCATNDDCSEDSYCNAGSCLLKKSAGMTCAKDSQCAPPNSYCVDGVCCESACDGPCQSCAEPSFAGTCKPLTSLPGCDVESSSGGAAGDSSVESLGGQPGSAGALSAGGRGQSGRKNSGGSPAQGEPTPSPSDPSGCGCRVDGAAKRAPRLLWLPLLGVGAALRRRARKLAEPKL